MPTKIKYTDWYSKPITKKQAHKRSECYRLTEQEGVVKQIDEYYENKLRSITYFISQNETDAEVLNILRTAHPTTEYILILEDEPIGSYTIEHQRNYSDRDHPEYLLKRSLKNARNEMICCEDTTLEELFQLDPSKQIDSVRRKYFYSENFYSSNLMNDHTDYGDFLVFEADYHTDGSLNYISLNHRSDQENETFRVSDYSKLVRRCNLDANQAEYYFTDTFLPSDLTF